MSAKVRPVTRVEARRLLLKRWAHAIAAARRIGHAYPLPDWKVMRNYEVEHLLDREFGVRRGRWVISEWCPYNGIFCAWRNHAPVRVLEAKIRWCERNRADGEKNGIHVDYWIEYIRQAIAARTVQGAAV